MAAHAAAPRVEREHRTDELEPAVHRRILKVLNDAVVPQDLVDDKPMVPHPELHEGDHEDNPAERHQKRRTILDAGIAGRFSSSASGSTRSGSAT